MISGRQLGASAAVVLAAFAIAIVLTILPVDPHARTGLSAAAAVLAIAGIVVSFGTGMAASLFLAWRRIRSTAGEAEIWPIVNVGRARVAIREAGGHEENIGSRGFMAASSAGLRIVNTDGATILDLPWSGVVTVRKASTSVPFAWPVTSIEITFQARETEVRAHIIPASCGIAGIYPAGDRDVTTVLSRIRAIQESRDSAAG
jgi:hypothetical protein